MGFAAVVTAAVLVVVMATMPEMAVAAVYRVGDAAGWTIIGGVDYKQWAATKTFQLGDVIVFEYNPQFHNVMRVTHGMYKSCNVSRPIETHTSGNDSITIQTRGHHFFLCGVPGHCQAGQKVDINVQHLTSTAAAPQPSALASPSIPIAHTPAAPAPKAAAAAPRLAAGFVLLLLAFSVGAIGVPVLA